MMNVLKMKMKVSTLNDDYIEKMADFYTSDLAEIVFPGIREVPFFEWLQAQARKKGMIIR